jgi:translation initiation factor eIF-2B subunit epsilon
MPPKGSTSGGSSSTKKAKETIKADEQPDEDPLVAVILADSYDNYFAPLTITTPRCLLPLANVPLIDYSIESATVTGVSQIYILSGAHSDQIRRHISANLQATLRNQSITITVLNTSEARSEGDAMRELDALQIIRSDFILYRADSVCTFDLKKAVQEHKRRRKADKDVIMTMACMPVQEDTAMRSKAVRSIHYVDPSTSQLLHYEQQNCYPRQKASLPNEVLRLDEKTGFEEIDIRDNLVEAGVEICSVDVPPLFTENFDYQSFSLDFIPGILTSDLLESKFYLQIYTSGYGGRARDTATYDAISKSILRRWTFPLTPANSAWIGDEYTERKGWNYIGQGVKSDRTTMIHSGSMVGPSCTLSADSSIVSSILGKGVQIGTSSHIANSHLHAEVYVGDKVKMDSCIIGQGAVLLDGVQLGKGCLIGAGCAIGPDITLRAGSRVGLRKKSWDDSDDEGEVDEVEEVKKDLRLGSGSKGVLWTNLWESKTSDEQNGIDEEDDDDDEIGNEDIHIVRLHAIGYSAPSERVDEDDSESVSSIEGDSDLDEMEDSDEDEDGFTDVDSKSALSSTFAKNVNLTLDDQVDTKEEQEASQARSEEFIIEAKASLQRAYEEGHTVDNAAIELKTLRMASNVSLSEVREITVDFLLSKCTPNNAKQVQQLMSRWAKLITLVSTDDEADAINLIQVSLPRYTSRRFMNNTFLTLRRTALRIQLIHLSSCHYSRSSTTTMSSKRKALYHGGEVKNPKSVLKSEKNYVKKLKVSFVTLLKTMTMKNQAMMMHDNIFKLQMPKSVAAM